LIKRINKKDKIIKVIETGIKALDDMLGIGGIPRGRFIEVYGEKGCGKTTLAMDIAVKAQEVGTVLYIDAENNFRPSYAEQRGLSSKDLIVLQPSNNADVFKIAEAVIYAHNISLIIVDSFSTLNPLYVTRNIQKFVDIIYKSEVSVLCISQIREKIGYGQIGASGKDLTRHVAIRVLLKKVKTLKKGMYNIGKLISAKTIKNKFAPPFQTAEFKLIYNKI